MVGKENALPGVVDRKGRCRKIVDRSARLAAATEGETGKPEESKEHGGWLRNAEGNLTETDAITTRRRTKSAVGKVV